MNKLKLSSIPVEMPFEKINQFCKKWGVKQLALFGSVLRDDFNLEKSDVDVLIEFSPGVHWGWDITNLKNELEKILNRPVDIVSKKAIQKSRNPYKKEEILGSYEVIYDEAS